MATCVICGKSYPDQIEFCDDDGGEVLSADVIDEEAELEEGQEIGDYVVRERIGKGACGTVYSAVHKLIGKEAAIKVLSRSHSSNRTMVARFLAEARAVNQIRHRNIVDIFAFGRLDDGRQFFVMELLVGETLEAHLKRVGPMDVTLALNVLRRIARALDAAHKHDIAHRDLKPENIFLVRDDDEVFPKLLDFGIAKLFGEKAATKTQTGAPIGTPLFMSPEQWRGRGVDHRTDIYSLGVVAYEMFTGRLPFDGDTVGDVMLAACGEEAPLATCVNDALPESLNMPLRRMLAKDPDDRPDSAGEAVQALHDAKGVPRDPHLADTSGGFDAVGFGEPRSSVPEMRNSVPEIRSSVPEIRSKADQTTIPVSQALIPTTRGRGRWVIPMVVVAALTFGLGALLMQSHDSPSDAATRSQHRVPHQPEPSVVASPGSGDMRAPSAPSSSTAVAAAPTRTESSSTTPPPRVVAPSPRVRPTRPPPAPDVKPTAQPTIAPDPDGLPVTAR